MMKITRLGTLFSSDYGCQAVVFSYDGLVVMNDEISLRLGRNLVRETRNQNISRDRNCDDKLRNEVR